MLPENQCCSYKQATKLFLLGVNGKGCLFCWLGNDPYSKERKIKLTSYVDHDLWYPAYTVAELGVLLGSFWYSGVSSGKTVESEGHKAYCHAYGDFEDRVVYGETEAQARAGMLIWLLENKHVKPEDLKLS